MPNLDETENEFRYRLKDPSKFDPKSLRYKEITDGVSLIVGCPKGQYQQGRCRVGVGPQVLWSSKAELTNKQALN